MSMTRRLSEITIFKEKENIFLCKFSPEEFNSSTYRGWFNDSIVTKYNSHGIFAFTEKEAKEYYETIDEKNTLVFAIYYNHYPTVQYIGNCCLQNINWINRSAEFAIVIGEKEYWGKGIATKVLEMLLEHAFTKMNLNRIWSGTVESNVGMQKVFTKLGFTREGIFKAAAFIQGKYESIFEYAILKSEYDFRNYEIERIKNA